MPLLLNAGAVIRCGHGGKFMVVSPRPMVGGMPGSKRSRRSRCDRRRLCLQRVSGARCMCDRLGDRGMCPRIMLAGARAVNQTLVCATSNSAPSIPVVSARQLTVRST